MENSRGVIRFLGVSKGLCSGGLRIVGWLELPPFLDAQPPYPKHGRVFHTRYENFAYHAKYHKGA